jgi:hypothetical protein
MKRNFLLLALTGAFAVAILANATRALATCPVIGGLQTVGTQLSGNYAIKVTGAQTDTQMCSYSGNMCPDPTPVPISGIGVINTDGACDVTGGEFIYNDGSSFTGPANYGYGPTFQGSLTANIVAGTGSPATNSNYYFNSNNQGVLTLVDSASGNTFEFAITYESGNTAFRGARLNPGDPLSITGELQPAVETTDFDNPSSIIFELEGTGVYSGTGYFSIEVTQAEHLDPETNTIQEGGGGIFWNLDNGYYFFSQTAPLGGGPLVWDFHQTILSGPSNTDGTQTALWTMNNDFVNFNQGNTAPGDLVQISSVVWGSSNQYQWAMRFNSNDPFYADVGIGTGGKVTAAGTDHLSAYSVALTSSVSNPNPSATLTLTNDSVEPLDLTGLTLSAGLTDVTVASYPDQVCTGWNLPVACCTGSGTGTCTVADCTGTNTPFAGCTGAGTGLLTTCGGDVPPNNVLFGPGTCTITLVDSGTSCTTTGANDQTGTLEIVGNDHVFAGGTQTSAGLTIPVTCK